MRRIIVCILCIMLLASLATPAAAASSASKVSVAATVSADGDCQVTVDVTLILESAVTELSFPLPRYARNITVNGTSARVTRSDDAAYVNITNLVKGVTGNFTFRLQYSLNNLVEYVKYEEVSKLELHLPLLSGFALPVDQMEFTINLPGQVSGKPIFSSGYFQQSIEEDITYTMTQATITGALKTKLKDQETLAMSLEVPEEVFPQNVTRQWSMGIPDVAMIVMAVLAALYWLIFLRCAPFLRSRYAVPPAGCTAGELSCVLMGQGSDLTMMVLSWAQLGYILIHLTDSGRVTLHKRMEMGNERSSYELKIFRSLFGKRRTVDGSGYHYANLCQRVAVFPGDVKDYFRSGTGNPRIFRILCAGIGLFGGAGMGIAMAGNALLGFLLVAIMAIFGAVSAWIMQDWVRGLHLRNNFSLFCGLGLAVLWLILGMVSNRLNVAACVAGAELLCGLAWFYGGRRTYNGRRTVSQVLGLRAYLRKLTPKDIKQLRQMDPDYFHTMAPYALALGVHKHFAKAFGNRKLSSCPYLTTGMDGHLTAAEWMRLLERAVDSLDARQKRLPLERLLGR
jgi:hypothetical protein